MPWIDHISYEDVKAANHPLEFGKDHLLIQLMTDGWSFPEPLAKDDFTLIRQYYVNDTDFDPKCRGMIAITEDVAKLIADDLQMCLDRDINVVVHCAAGVSRSGAVAEVAADMGFRDIGKEQGKWRRPNLTIKKALQKQLGMLMFEKTDES